MFDERLFEKGVVMSAQLSFDLEELTHQRVVGLGDYQMAKRQIATVKRPRLQLVDATYIERARAKSRHPAGSKLPCPKAVGRRTVRMGQGQLSTHFQLGFAAVIALLLYVRVLRRKVSSASQL